MENKTHVPNHQPDMVDVIDNDMVLCDLDHELQKTNCGRYM